MENNDGSSPRSVQMVVRPVAEILHILLYVGFIVTNIEVIEIIIDGIFGTQYTFIYGWFL